MEEDRGLKRTNNYRISKIGKSQTSRARDTPVQSRGHQNHNQNHNQNYNQSQNQNLKYNISSKVVQRPGEKNEQPNTKSTIQSNTRLPKINQKFINKK